MTELGITAEFVKSEFEWDALASRPGIELWAIRAPRDLKPSRLSALSIPVPKKDEPLTGNLKTKSQSYILRTAGFTGSSSSSKAGEQGQGLVDSLGMGDGEGVDQLAEEGGEEMGGLRLLVPRVKDHGKLLVGESVSPAVLPRMKQCSDLSFLFSLGLKLHCLYHAISSSHPTFQRNPLLTPTPTPNPSPISSEKPPNKHPPQPPPNVPSLPT